MRERGDLIYQIEIPDYPSKIKLSESRNPVYYKRSKHLNKLPNKYMTPRYYWDENGFLFDAEENKRVIKNSRSVGTPKYWVVNFQAIWNQAIKYQARANITAKLKEVFRPYIKVLQPITEYPIAIEILLLDTTMPVDVDNKGVIYTKVITDLLVNTDKGLNHNKKIIEEDSSEYVNDTGRCKWVKVDEDKDIKMIIRIWKSNNKLE